MRSPSLLLALLAGCADGPEVSFLAPETDFHGRDFVTLVAEAHGERDILHVRFFADNAFIGEDPTAPYEMTWNTDDSPEGVRALRAVATDSADETAEDTLEITVDRTAPVVAILAPDDADPIHGINPVLASVEDNLSIARVEWSVDGVALGTREAPPWSVDWDADAVSYGPHTVEVSAFDLAGNKGNVTLSVQVDHPPTIHLTRPLAGETLLPDQEVTADALDDQRVTEVRFLVDGEVQRTLTTDPWRWDWDTCSLSHGTHALRAEASDILEQIGSEEITVTADRPLEILLSAPDGRLDPTRPPVALAANDEGVTVAFDLDGLPLGLPVSSSGVGLCDFPCGCERFVNAWDHTPVASGNYTLTATATNTSGETASASVPILVQKDDDGDGFDGSIWEGSDCDDANAAIFPGTPEVCNATDDDCDGSTDEGFDLDADGYSTCAGDCDDDNSLIHPGAIDACRDAIDEDCANGPAECSWELSTADAKFTGEDTGDHAGWSVAGAGDFNADGFDDILVSAPHYSKGRTYLILGPPSGDLDLSQADTYFTRTGEEVAGAGDVNGDGFDDFLMGEPYNWINGAHAGAAFLVYGNARGNSHVEAHFYGEEAGDRLGWSVAGAGDVNADGFDDILLGTRDYSSLDPGGAYLILGPVVGEMNVADADAIFVGVAAGDHAGYSVSGAGDTNGDGFDDILIGAPDNDAGGLYAGTAYLVLGPISGSVDLSNADAIFYAEDADDSAGHSVAGVGDTDGDGFDDILIGAPGNDATGHNAGAAYLVLGPVSGAIDLTFADAILYGEGTSDGLGEVVSGAGDADADGLADLLISAPSERIGGGYPGSTYLVRSPVSGAVDISKSDKFYGEASDDRAYHAAGVGDVNGDGRDDILIGASDNNSGGVESGAAYLIYPYP